MGRRRYYGKRKRGRKRKATVRRSPSTSYQKYRMTALCDVVTSNEAGTNTALGDVNLLFKSYDPSAVRRLLKANITADTPLNNLGAMQNLWDMFRVQYCKLTYRPSIKDGQVINSGDGGTGTVPTNWIGKFPNLLISYDPDNINVSQTPFDLIQKKGVKSFDCTRSFTFTWKPKRISAGAAGAANDLPAPSVFENGWMNMQGPFAQQGEVQLRSEEPFVDTGAGGSAPQPVEGVQIGNILIEYYLEFKSPK